MHVRNFLFLLAAVLLAPQAMGGAAPYPAKPVRIIVSFPAGSGTGPALPQQFANTGSRGSTPGELRTFVNPALANWATAKTAGSQPE